MDAAQMVARSAAERYRAVPVASASDGALIVAVQDDLTRAQLESRVDPRAGAPQPQLVQSVPLGARVAVERDVVDRGPAPTARAPGGGA